MVERTKSSQIGEKATLLVEKIFNEANWVCNRLHPDFGIDLYVKVVESEHITPWEFHVQIKGTERPHISKGHIHFAIDTEHLKYWYDSPLPVLFVICDVQSEKAYWLWVKEYLEEIDKKYFDELIHKDLPYLDYLEFVEEPLEIKRTHSDKFDWQARSKFTLRIPIGNQLTPEVLPRLFADLRRKTLMHNALRIIGFIETPNEINESSFCFCSPYYRPLPKLDQSIEKPALARCILCGNYFWIEENVAIDWEFPKIYGPYPHEPAVYDCEAPEEFCPVCTSGKGALEQCKNCGRYAVLPLDDEFYEDWDDPLVSGDEAKQLCYECLEELREQRKHESKGSNLI